MILSDREIRELCFDYPKGKLKNDDKPMIEPFSEATSAGAISYGLTSAGYDLRLFNTLKIFKSSFGECIDPKRFREKGYEQKVFDVVESVTGPVILPAHSYALGRSLEYLRIPRWLRGTVVGKSTYARCGLIVNCTPLEPGWEGFLVIELANVTPCPIVLYTEEGIAQMELHRLSLLPETDYSQKQGKYQGQTGIQAAIVK